MVNLEALNNFFRPVNTGTIMPTFKSEAKDGSSLIVVPGTIITIRYKAKLES